MRITKKFLRDQKLAMQRRLRQLAYMDPQQLATEFARCFPNADASQFKGQGEMLSFILSDAVERSFPSHLVD